MVRAKDWAWGLLAVGAGAALLPTAVAAAGIQIGPSGKTYASASLACGLNPMTGFGPVVQAGLYTTKKATGTVSLNGQTVAIVTRLQPDATVWLSNGVDTVSVATGKIVDSYTFDAGTTYPGQPNVCIPDNRGNTVSGDLEYAASGKSYAVVTPGCAFNPLTGRSQPFVNLFDNGRYLLNVSVNDVPLTQLNGTTRTHVAAFLAAGLNLISAANGTQSTDYYVRDGGSGTCTLP